MIIKNRRNDFASIEALEPRQLLAAGVLDPTFGNGGTVTNEFIGGTKNQAQAVAVQRDGRAIVAGNSIVAGGTPIVSMARYLTTGSLDPTFGVDGRAASNYGYVSQIAIRRDGKIITAGADSDLLVERFLPSGAIDPTFTQISQEGPGIERIQILNDVADIRVKAMTVRPDGRFLLAIEYARNIANQPLHYQGALVQIRADGGLDASFGEAGILKLGTASSDGEVKISALLLQDDTTVIAAGTTNGDFAVMRFMPDGTIDSTFAHDAKTGGLWRFDFGTPSDAAIALVPMRDGRIVVIGNAANDVAVERLFPDGKPDPTLGRRGGVTIPSGLHTAFQVTSAQLGPRGRIVISGTLKHNGTRSLGDTSEPAAFQLLPAGLVDRSFGASGLARAPNLLSGLQLADSAATSDGGIILAASTPYISDFTTAKLTADGKLDPIFGNNATSPGIVRTSFTGPAGMTLYDTIVLRSGKIMAIAVRSAGDARGEFFVARWNADGSLDTSFGPDGSGTSIFVDAVPDKARLFELRHGNVLAVFNNFIGPGVATIAPDGKITAQSQSERIVIPNFYVADSALDSSGRMLVAGNNKLVRLTAGGSLDVQFGTGGIVDLPFDPSTIASLPDGKVIVAGVIPPLSEGLTTGRVGAAQYLPNGRPDLSFGNAGVMLVAPGPEGDRDTNPFLAVQKNGRVILALSRYIPQSLEGERFGLLFGISSTGRLDPTFGNNGPSAAIAYGFGIRRIIVDPQQRILALGLNDVDPSPTFSVTNTSVTRFTENGQLDQTFGSHDAEATISDSGAMPAAIALQGDGGIIAATFNFRANISFSRLSGDDISAQVVSNALQIIANTSAAVQIRAHVNGNNVMIEGTPQTFDLRTFSRVTVRTGDGDDLIDLSQLNLPAQIEADDGNDSILAGPANDSIAGGNGDDTIFGGSGNDTLHGNDGNDYLNGGPGSDQIFGEGGNDQFFATDSMTDTIDGGDGFDRAKRDLTDLVTRIEEEL